MPPQAVRVLREAGVDITGQSFKLVSTLTAVPFDLVITVYGHADEHCPAVLRQAHVVQLGSTILPSRPTLPPMKKQDGNTTGGFAMTIRDFITHQQGDSL